MIKIDTRLSQSQPDGRRPADNGHLLPTDAWTGPPNCGLAH